MEKLRQPYDAAHRREAQAQDNAQLVARAPCRARLEYTSWLRCHCGRDYRRARGAVSSFVRVDTMLAVIADVPAVVIADVPAVVIADVPAALSPRDAGPAAWHVSSSSTPSIQGSALWPTAVATRVNILQITSFLPASPRVAPVVAFKQTPVHSEFLAKVSTRPTTLKSCARIG